MAIWQFALDPIPASKAEQFSQGDAGSGELELSSPDRAKLIFRLAAILPPGRSWDENMRTWGDEWGDDISLFMSASGVEGMQIRVNIADLSVGFVDAICTLAQDFGWLFASESGEIIQPNRQAILKAVDKSPESKFVRNPAEFVARSSRRKKGPSRQSGRPKSGK